MTDWPINWNDVVAEARRRRTSEGLSQRALADLAGVSLPTVNSFEQGKVGLQFESVIAILEALGMFVRPDEPDSFEAFRHRARRRWEELVGSLPADHSSRQPLGHSEQAYSIGTEDPLPSPRELLKLLASIPGSTGWPPFWVPTRPEIRPTIEEGLVECWLGRPETDTAFDDPAHSDFWQISREGYAYLQRGYQEDGPGNLEPGTIFDVTLPIWRTAEVLLHATNLAKQLELSGSTLVQLTGRYTGLEGRELISWAKPLLRTIVGTRYRARSTKIDLKVAAKLRSLEEDLPSVVAEFLGPLYERFDGYQVPLELVASQIEELRKLPKNRRH